MRSICCHGQWFLNEDAFLSALGPESPPRPAYVPWQRCSSVCWRADGEQGKLRAQKALARLACCGRHFLSPGPVPQAVARSLEACPSHRRVLGRAHKQCRDHEPLQYCAGGELIRESRVLGAALLHPSTLPHKRSAPPCRPWAPGRRRWRRWSACCSSRTTSSGWRRCGRSTRSSSRRVGGAGDADRGQGVCIAGPGDAQELQGGRAGPAGGRQQPLPPAARPAPPPMPPARAARTHRRPTRRS